MLKIMKYLKKSIIPILAIIALLVVQAMSDLALPDYTSRIVNVGIQQGGIENSTPTDIRESEMNKLTLFMSPTDKDKVLKYYQPSTSTSNKKEPLLSITTKDKEIIAELNKIFEKPMLVVSGINSGAPEMTTFRDQLLSQLPPQMKQGDVDLFELLKMMPEEQLDMIRTEINKKFDSMPDSIITQSAIAYTHSEYEAIGLDTQAMRTKYIFSAGAKMLLIALISMAATILVVLLSSRVAALFGMDLRQLVFKKVVSFSNNELDKFSTASLITRSTNDIQQIQMLMVMMLRIIFYAPILGIGGVIKVLNTNTSMAWIIAVAVLTLLSIMGILFAIVMPRFQLVQKLLDKLNLVSREILTGLPVIRAFSTQKHEEKRFDIANKDLTKTNLFVNRIMSGMMPLMMLIMNGITVLIVWKGAYGINDGAMQVGDLMAFIQYTMQIIMAFLMISMISIMIPRASVSANRIHEVLSTPADILDPVNPKQINSNKKGYIEFKDVSFRYANAEEDVINNISFVAKPGETTAFIGSTGSGKSTLINLIPRFYDVTEGEILVDGINVKDISQHDLRDKIGYVPQKGVLFSGTIESNIKFGNVDATDEEMKKAAEIAQAMDFIVEKEDGFTSDISQGGTNVSGGQKQRLSIARAIAKNPEIYIFDDSFSALDYKTDIVLRKALKQHTSESTVLIVAQRISTILHADQIIVLEEGQIIGKGTHKELLQSCDVYQQIALSQLSKEELANE